MVNIICNIFIYIKYLFVLIFIFCFIQGCQNNAQQNSSIQNKLQGVIVYGNNDKIAAYNISTKHTKIVYPNKPTDPPSNPEWANDGIYLQLFDVKNHSNKNYIAAINNEGSYLYKIFDSSNAVKPSISFDKSKLAFLCGNWSKDLGRIDYKLCVSNIDGSGNKIIKLQLFSDKPSWSPNGQDIAVTDLSKNILIVNHKTGVAQILTKGTAPSFSPDGKSLAFVRQKQSQSNSERSNLILIDLLTMKEHALIENYYFGVSPKWTPQWSSDGKFIIYAYFGKIILPPERQIVEAYSLESKKSFKLFEVNNQITGFSYKK